MNQAEQKFLEAIDNTPELPLLEKWSHCDCGQIVGKHLFGNVYNHPNFPQGKLVHTSKLQYIFGSFAQCRSRLYKLGVPA